MEKQVKLTAIVTFRVPAGFTAELERARRALGFRSHSDVIRAALAEYLGKDKGVKSGDGQRWR